MDLESEILREHTKRQTVRLARWVGNDKVRFKLLMELFLHGEFRLAQRAAWVVSHCAERHPHLINPWIRQMVRRMQEPGVHIAVKRNAVRILQFVEIPYSLQGTVANICFGYLQTPGTPVAIQAFSMTVLARIAEQQPDLRNEIRLIIRQMMPYGSGGIQSRAKHVLKILG